MTEKKKPATAKKPAAKKSVPESIMPGRGHGDPQGPVRTGGGTVNTGKPGPIPKKR